MRRLLTGLVFAALTLPAADAFGQVYALHDHPNGAEAPPAYGLRVDDLLSDAVYTFSFDYPGAAVFLTYDPIGESFTIQGSAYGGKITSHSYDVTEQGWIDLDFTYSVDVVESDDCTGAPGNDIHVTSESVLNGGTLTLVGWGGDGVYAFTDKANGSGCSFLFDNDSDSKGNAAIANDPDVFSGSGWLQPGAASGSRDWLFTGLELTTANEEASWGSFKELFR